LYAIDGRKLYNLKFIDLKKIYMDCMGKIFFLYINYWGALEASPYRNKDVLPKSTPFYKKVAFACKRPFFKKRRFILNASF
jgi:hypothetical protein